MNQLHESHIVPILNKQKPQKMLEIGVLEGRHTHSLLTWCRDAGGVLTSVDPTPWTGKIPEALRPGAGGYLYKRGHDSEKDALRPTFIERIFAEGLAGPWTCVKALSLTFLAGCEAQFDAVFIDGDHNYYTVINELTLLAPLMARDGVIFVHDIANPSCAERDYYYDFTLIPDAFRNGEKQGIVTAIEDFLAQFPDFDYRVLTEAENGLGLLRRR